MILTLCYSYSMKNLLLKPLISLSFALSFISLAHAQTQDTDVRPFGKQLNAAQIKSEFTGTTLDGAYQFISPRTAEKNYIETHYANSTVRYIEGNVDTKGYWQVIDDYVCYNYPYSFFSGGCFQIYKVENCYYFYSLKDMRLNRKLGDELWTARAVKKDETPLCEALFS